MKESKRRYLDQRHHALRLILDESSSCRAMHYSNREIANIVGISKTTVGRLRRTAKANNLAWRDMAHLGAVEHNRLLNRPSYVGAHRCHPDWAHVHAQMQHPDMTIQKLWRTYQQTHPEMALCYSQFAKLYRDHRETLLPHGEMKPLARAALLRLPQRPFRCPCPDPRPSRQRCSPPRHRDPALPTRQTPSLTLPSSSTAGRTPAPTTRTFP